ncbi:MAG TPA: PAS domain S-box protein, partial [Chloroflexota bacterium]
MSIDHDRGAGGPPPEPRVSLERALEQALSLLAQKESELAEVRRSEESYRSLVEKVMDFVFCVDRQGRFTFVNSAVLSLLGYRPEELIGNHFLSVVAEGSRQIAASEFQRNMESSGPRVIYEVEVLSKDGRRIPMEIHGTNVYENGTVAGVRGIARDVSDRRRAEERQKHYISELQTINQIGQQIASVLDLDELLPFIVQAIRKRPEYHYVNVFLRDETGKSVVLKATAGDYGYPLPLGTTLKIGGEGIVGLVAKTGKPVMANDVTKEPRYLATSELQLTKSELAVPVRLGRQVVGVLDIESDLLNAFDEADLRAAMTLADEISVALRNAELFEAERQRREETAIILEVTRAVNSTLLLDEVLRVAARGMARAVGVPNCG